MSQTFTYLNRQGVKSSKGFIIQFTARREMQYQENEHILKIEVEGGRDDSGAYNLAVYAQDIKYWQPPYDNEVISEEEKKEIIQNISEALDFMKIGHILYTE